jgi:hypothetical protein
MKNKLFEAIVTIILLSGFSIGVSILMGSFVPTSPLHLYYLIRLYKEC